MAFYASLLDDAPLTLQQGDLLARVPFTYFNLANTLVTTASGVTDYRDLTEEAKTTDVAGVFSKVEFVWGLLLSQTCDLQPQEPQEPSSRSRKPILVARVSPIKSIVPSFKDANVSQVVDSVRKLATAGSAPNLLYLPAYVGEGFELPRSGADLLDVQRFPRDDLPALKRLARLRLGDEALRALQERCAYCFGRFAAPDDLYYSSDEVAEIERKEREHRRSQGQEA